MLDVRLPRAIKYFWGVSKIFGNQKKVILIFWRFFFVWGPGPYGWRKRWVYQRVAFTFLFDLSFDRYNDGTVKLRNPNIELMDQDILYHLALGSGSHDLEEMFGDVKVCFSFAPQRSALN